VEIMFSVTMTNSNFGIQYWTALVFLLCHRFLWCSYSC